VDEVRRQDVAAFRKMLGGNNNPSPLAGEGRERGRAASAAQKTRPSRNASPPSSSRPGRSPSPRSPSASRPPPRGGRDR
jgi:hypothetical protein